MRPCRGVFPCPITKTQPDAANLTLYRLDPNRGRMLAMSSIHLVALYGNQFHGWGGGASTGSVGLSGGSQEDLFTIEACWRWPRNFQLTGFYDLGPIRINRDNDFAGAPVRNQYGLSDGGWACSGLHLNPVWARRIGDKPNRVTNGRDADGTLDLNLIWLMGSMPF